MKNNLAELTDIDIDLDSLQASWAEQVSFASDHTWERRNYVSYTFFTVYFQHLLLDIENILGEKPKDYIIQMHDPNIVVNDKWYLNIAHKDEDRKSCINIPVYYNRMEPVNFYDDLADIPDRGQPITATPNQIGQYSDHHPTLMNVNNYHNVRVIDESQPRIFIQMSYDISFDEFIQKGINTRIL
jgi:hypothetical protein